MSNQKINWDVEGMSCVNCAQSINKYLESSHLQDVQVDFASGKVSFVLTEEAPELTSLEKGLSRIGYSIKKQGDRAPFWTLERKLLVSAVFTIPLVVSHFFMIGGIHFLQSPWTQFALALPAIIIGILHFGKSAIGSLRSSVPNMDVLIFVGGLAATIYSIIGLVMQEPNYIFFETAASIFTLVLVGNYLEHRSVKQTTSALDALQSLVPTRAHRIQADGTIEEVDAGDIQLNDLLLVKEGEQIPMDGQLQKGAGTVDQSMVTGESMPVDKQATDTLIGGTILTAGHLEMRVTALSESSVLGQIIHLVEKAQQDKPPIQRLADRISAIFVPVVLGIAVLTFLVSWLGFELAPTKALINSIAVLVISCPCAMGLATPTAVMVGVGRMARRGIVVKGGKTLEELKTIKNIVFDKTGTITSGAFSIDKIHYFGNDKDYVRQLIKEMESRSAHPIAKSILKEAKKWSLAPMKDSLTIIEQKGIGLMAKDAAGNEYRIGSKRILSEDGEAIHDVYLTKNNQLLAAIDLSDSLKVGTKDLVRYLQHQGYRLIILSGDREGKVAKIAQKLGIQEYHSEKLPEEKLHIIEQLSQSAPTAMVGDGINDAPALAKATLGISLGNASAVAVESAQIILLGDNMNSLIEAFKIGHATVRTIHQNLFWAFAYNIVAIPIAAVGLLSPMFGAAFMAFSDVVVIGNSLRLRKQKL